MNPLVGACRVLEIGCGDGSNLIPMACHLPESRFAGVDLSAAAIAKGRRTIDDLGLANINLVAADLRDIGPDYGSFDYIIAHGVYSWVPAPVRDGLLAVCGRRFRRKASPTSAITPIRDAMSARCWAT